MTSKSVSIKLFGRHATSVCKECGETYEVCDSNAWDMQFFCCGECEEISEFNPSETVEEDDE